MTNADAHVLRLTDTHVLRNDGLIMIFLIALILVVGVMISIARSNSKSLRLQKRQAEEWRIAEKARARREAGLPAYDRRGLLAKLCGVKAPKRA